MTLIMENRNDSTLFTYSVTFSNSTATASITTNITNSSMTLSFTVSQLGTLSLSSIPRIPQCRISGT